MSDAQKIAVFVAASVAFVLLPWLIAEVRKIKHATAVKVLGIAIGVAVVAAIRDVSGTADALILPGLAAWLAVLLWSAIDQRRAPAAS